MSFNSSFKINKKIIGLGRPVYFIADIAANHNGDLNRAKDLIKLCADSGADAAKFQHFNAKTIISKDGFSKFKNKLSHQKSWKKSVYEVYEDASLNLDWTFELKEECKKNNIDFFTSPYSFELVDYVNKFVPAYKIGSGDITWKDIIEHIAKKNKPVILATGASNSKEVDNAISWIKKINSKLAVLQCNTNYTGSRVNFNFINLNYLKILKKKYKNMIVGLSDHTPGDVTVLGAIALGAKIIEKHFTDSNSREGPDHAFSLIPQDWKKMVENSRILEDSLGSGIKQLEDNEKDTVFIQRRSVRSTRNIPKGTKLHINRDLVCLRPYEKNSIQPFEISKLINKVTMKDIVEGQALKWSMIKT